MSIFKGPSRRECGRYWVLVQGSQDGTGRTDLHKGSTWWELLEAEHPIGIMASRGRWGQSLRALHPGGASAVLERVRVTES